MNKEEFEIRSSDLVTKGNIVHGRAVVFDSFSIDLGGFVEMIHRGAITNEMIQSSDIFARVEHNRDCILARCKNGEGSLKLDLRDDGLYYEFELPETEKGRELRSHIERGEISTCSFAFHVPEVQGAQVWTKRDDGLWQRDIYAIDAIGDIAPVYSAAYNDTTVALRSLQTVQDLELRSADGSEKEEEQREDPKEEPAEEPAEESKEEPKEEEPAEESKEEPKEEPAEEPKEEPKEEKRNKSINMNTEFRLLKAINDIANNKSVDATASAVIGAGNAEMRSAGLSFGGQIQIPAEELRSAITVNVEGEDVVATELYDILGPLRAKNVLVQAGAKFLTGLVGDIQVPIMSAGNVTWEGETDAAQDGAQTFTSVKLSPKRLTAYVDISKQFLVQDSKSAEALIRQDIINAINDKLEETILGSEAGTLTQPAGIFYNDGEDLDVVDSYADLAQFESGIEDANVTGECKYVMSNKAKATYRTMQKANGVGFVYENGTIDGTAVLNTSHVEDSNIAYGDWSNLAIGQWGAVDLTVDPFTQAKNGMVRLVVNAYFDAKVLRPEAILVASAEATE